MHRAAHALMEAVFACKNFRESPVEDELDRKLLDAARFADLLDRT